MDIFELKIGTKLEFSLVTGSASLLGAVYVSQFLDIIDAENVIIATPIANSRIVFIPEGFNIKVTLLDSKYGLWGFKGLVVKRGIRENINILQIKVQGALERIQRRQYFRLDSLLNAEYRLLKEQRPEAAAEEDIPFKQAVTRNISGSGVCLAVEDEIPRDSMLEVGLNFDSCGHVIVKAQVIRCTKLPGSKPEKYEIGLHFRDLPKNVQDAIIKYVFDQQRILIQKGLLDGKNL